MAACECYKINTIFFCYGFANRHRLKLRNWMGFCAPIAAMSLPAHIALLKRHCGEGKVANFAELVESLR